MKRIALIDGDELVYKIGFATQQTEWSVIDPDKKVLVRASTKADVIEALGDEDAEGLELSHTIHPKDPKLVPFVAKAIINMIQQDTKCDKYQVFLTGEKNFRDEIATLLPYKGDRDHSTRPIYYKEATDLLKLRYRAQVVEGREADDAMSIYQWYHLKNDTGWESVICSQDKDLRMVPGLNYNPTTRKLDDISVGYARLWFFTQLLTGDKSVDNIPGIYRMGPAKAAEVFKGHEGKPYQELLKIVLDQYEIARNNPKVASKMPGDKWGIDRVTEIARLLWMQQEKDQLWEPWVDYYA